MLFDDLILFVESGGIPIELQAPVAPDTVILLDSLYEGEKVILTPVTVQSMLGIDSPRISDLIFNQIHFLPSTVYNLGVLYTTLIESTFIWNTLSTSISILELNSVDIDGVTTDYEIGSVASFEIIQGDITFSSSGSSEVNGYYEIVTDVRTIVIDISFTRALVFPFIISDVDSLTVDLSFSTVIDTNRYQKELRRAILVDPQRRTSFSLLETETNKLKIKNLLKFGQDKTFIVPMYMELLEVSYVSGSIIYFSNDFSEYWNLLNYCNTLALYNGSTGECYTYEVVSIDVSNKSITVAYSIVETLSSDFIGFPAFLGSVLPVNLLNVTDSIGTIDMSFEEDVSESMPSLVVPTEPTGYFDTKPNWEVEPTTLFSTIRDAKQYPGTIKTTYSLVDSGREINTYGYRLEFDKLYSLINDFCYYKGRLGSFYFKDQTPIMYVASTIFSTDTSIAVNDAKFELAWYSGFLIIIEANGVVYEREILSVSIASGGVQHISIDSDLGVELQPSEVFIYVKRKVRFDKDVLSLTFPAITVADVELDFFELIQEV